MTILTKSAGLTASFKKSHYREVFRYRLVAKLFFLLRLRDNFRQVALSVREHFFPILSSFRSYSVSLAFANLV